jgi:hypothetical protein
MQKPGVMPGFSFARAEVLIWRYARLISTFGRHSMRNALFVILSVGLLSPMPSLAASLGHLSTPSTTIKMGPGVSVKPPAPTHPAPLTSSPNGPTSIGLGAQGGGRCVKRLGKDGNYICCGGPKYWTCTKQPSRL